MYGPASKSFCAVYFILLACCMTTVRLPPLALIFMNGLCERQLQPVILIRGLSRIVSEIQWSLP